MKKLLLAGAVSFALTGFAAAADATMPVSEQMRDWSGIYAGIQGGGGWSNQQWTSGGGGLTTGDFSGNGALIGGTFGYNWQNASTVWGIEGDISWSDISATNGATGGCAAIAPCTAQINWLATIRGRVGYLVQPQWLIYATGGVAFAEIENDQLAFSPLAIATTTKTGWTVGGGVEGVLAGNWTGKVEYLFVDFDQTAFCAAGVCGATGAASDYTRIHIFRAGLNYKLN